MISELELNWVTQMIDGDLGDWVERGKRVEIDQCWGLRPSLKFSKIKIKIKKKRDRMAWKRRKRVKWVLKWTQLSLFWSVLVWIRFLNLMEDELEGIVLLLFLLLCWLRWQTDRVEIKSKSVSKPFDSQEIWTNHHFDGSKFDFKDLIFYFEPSLQTSLHHHHPRPINHQALSYT